jgi:hypothetical protein
MNDDQFTLLQEILSALYIQTARNYDLLSIIASTLGADAVSLYKEHENGNLLAPEPWINDENNAP